MKKFSILALVIFLSACVNYSKMTNALAPGMTKQEVVNIMGSPYEKSINGKKETYIYRAYRGDAYVDFDENGLLEGAH
ncbi:outer membrane protein assembly factor BamE domain-containing protein [Haemophilus haemolyticus]|uniref:outer membrane protein assembly factor BamE domain-containing protein n=1 Tax=Haemophilus haemolyticus TaxID=726 RepID=UPI0011261045|nr:outer membrane protein assembly factor BamE [Haemophilus haemolyticus]TPH11611.1 outer membrane protein assembly factor BamE [Haemophilus haemolyticus]